MPDTASGSPEPAVSSRRRLLAGLTGRPGRGQVIGAVLVALLGFAATVQIRLTHSSDAFAGQRRQDLVVLLDSLSTATDRVQQQINQLQDTKTQLESASHRRAAAIADEQQRLATLGILAGTIGAEGPGVTVTINDPSHAVTAATILNGIEELRDAGAEAIEIDDKARVVASTAITQSGQAIKVDGVVVPPPYVIDAIGSSHTLSQAVVFPGGLSDEVTSLGGQVAVQERSLVKITALHSVKPPQYAHSTGP